LCIDCLSTVSFCYQSSLQQKYPPFARTHQRRQLWGMIFTAVCLCVCFSARYLKNRYANTNVHTNVPRWVLRTHLFPDQKVKGQGHDSRVTKTETACVFALLWVLASSHFTSSPIPTESLLNANLKWSLTQSTNWKLFLRAQTPSVNVGSNWLYV